MDFEFNLTPEQMAAITDYVNDGVRGEHTDAAIWVVQNAFGRICTRMKSETAQQARVITRLRSRIAAHDEKERARVLEGDFGETGLDSVDVAKVLLYHLQQLTTWQLGKDKMMLILFEMYASWLHSKRERLFVEGFVAQEKGPWLWRVAKRIERADIPVHYEQVRALAERNPGVAAFCQRAAQKYYDYGEKQIRDYVLKCPAYRKAAPKEEGAKWNATLDDREIFFWKEEQQKR